MKIITSQEMGDTSSDSYKIGYARQALSGVRDQLESFRQEVEKDKNDPNMIEYILQNQYPLIIGEIDRGLELLGPSELTPTNDPDETAGSPNIF